MERRMEPPSLLNTLISMFLTPGTVDPKTQLYPGQGVVQAALLLMAVVYVPIMLLSKPYHVWSQMKAHEGAGERMGERDANGGAVVADGRDDEEEPHEFSDVVIHQVIHTIEFCLGCISHTASHLRLLALSLVHAQLSEVLWDMIFESSRRAPRLVPADVCWDDVVFADSGDFVSYGGLVGVLACVEAALGGGE
ncbi:V-type proton ATPase subunit a [Mycena kentingensis (nom. inval.)]|nr:V-type proton ATPase subunit a [Mycena kentingensis (nom. inval.)]